MNQSKIKNVLILIIFIGFSELGLAAEAGSSGYSDIEIWAYNSIADKLRQYRKDRSRWDSLIRKFRRDHNLSAVGGVSKTRWHLGAFNDPKEDNNSNYFLSLEYCFHIPIYKRVGYLLGSSLGVSYQQFATGDIITTGKSYNLPGLIVGLVWNVNSYSRVTTSLKGNLLRVENLEIDNLAKEPKSSLRSDHTGRSFAYGMAVDLFLKLEWGVRFEGEVIRSTFHSINDAPEASILSHSFSKNEQRYGVGLVYHVI